MQSRIWAQTDKRRNNNDYLPHTDSYNLAHTHSAAAQTASPRPMLELLELINRYVLLACMLPQHSSQGCSLEQHER